MTNNQLTWMIGGSQGTGVDSSALLFGRACTLGGLYGYGNREYYSNIKGEHSYFMVRVHQKIIHSPLSKPDLLATFDAETVIRHALSVNVDGGIIYNSELSNVKLTDIPTLEHRVLEDLVTYLDNNKLEHSVNGILEASRRNGVHIYAIPYGDLLKEAASTLGEPKLSNLTRMMNTMAVAASFGLLEFDLNVLDSAISRTFHGKSKIIQLNMTVGKSAYDYVKGKYASGFQYKLKKVQTEEKRVFLQGNQATALGKLVGGCRVQTYYPISPASDESDYLEANQILKINPRRLSDSSNVEKTTYLEKNGGSVLVLQTEDETAAITAAIGAALSGARSSTSTSGPGFCLMVEGMGWAGINEVPVVITYYQRGGPSTGMPTRQEQGDLRFALHAGQGEFPRIILASGDQRECFYDAVHSFNYAERYQLPVIHLIDKTLANSTATYPMFDLSGIRIDRGAITNGENLNNLSSGDKTYKRFLFTEDGISPRTLLGTKGGVFWNTGDEHDEYGHITEDPVVRVRMMDKRMKKLETIDHEVPIQERLTLHGNEESDVTIVSWGSPKGAIIDAMDALNDENIHVNFLQIRMINPLPSENIISVLSRAKKTIGIEMNYSAQLAGWIRESTGIAIDHHVVKYNGRPISQDEVCDSIKKLVKYDAPKRLVLTHGT